MLDYAAAAQVYFDYRTDDLANAIDETYLNTYRKEYSTEMLESVVYPDDSLVGDWVRNREHVPTIMPSLILEGIITNNYRVRFSDEIMDNVARADIMFWNKTDYEQMFANSEKFSEQNVSFVTEMILDSDGYYKGGYNKTAVKNMGDTLYACIKVTTLTSEVYYSGIVAYSSHAYIAEKDTGNNETLAQLVAKLAVYGNTAKYYFENR